MYEPVIFFKSLTLCPFTRTWTSKDKQHWRFLYGFNFLCLQSIFYCSVNFIYTLLCIYFYYFFFLLKNLNNWFGFRSECIKPFFNCFNVIISSTCKKIMVFIEKPDVSPLLISLFSITSNEHSTNSKNLTSTEFLMISFQAFKFS